MKRSLKYHLSRWLFPFLSVTLAVYFLYHLFEGESGLNVWRSVEDSVAEAQESLDVAIAEYNTYQNKINHLSAQNLDADLLDERVRLMLSQAGDNEVILLFD